jgi:hypothetical protein
LFVSGASSSAFRIPLNRHNMPAKRKSADAPVDVMWAEQTVGCIKEELERRGLSKAGKKADLVARLDADIAAAAAAIAKENASSIIWAEQTVSRIKEELERRGMPRSGKKADLVARLDADDHAAAIAASNLAPKEKKLKKSKNASPDPELEGQTAGELMEYKNQGRSGEIRARPFVAAPDDEYRKKFKKVKKERMFMLGRTKTVDNGGVVSEIFDIAGSTGNIYQTTIGRTPKCTCMDAVSVFSHFIPRAHANQTQRIRGQKCKHIYCETPPLRTAPESPIREC